MARLDGFKGWEMGWASAARLLTLSALGLVPGVGLKVAQGQAQVPADPGYTLRAYTNSIQIPVLVLSREHQQMAQVDGARFGISLDSGPVFRPSHVRLEGDDAISLAILLDLNDVEAEVVPSLAKALAGLAPRSLRAKDHVSVYVIDCQMIEMLTDAPADAASLQRAVDGGVKAWLERRRSKESKPCKETVPLWDGLAFAINQLYKTPGRRVALVVTNGHDEGSRNSWGEVRGFAQGTGVAVFGMRSMLEMPDWVHTQGEHVENALREVCELSGGMVMTASSRTVAERMQGFVAAVRGRYIVEFPRPYHGMAGEHSLAVTIAKSGGAFIRPAGIAVPLADPKVMADPNTVPSDPGKTPEFGTRKVLGRKR